MSLDTRFLAPAHSIHQGFARAFRREGMSLGFILPLEAYPNRPAPTMADHLSLAKLADDLGFAALWARDVPTYDPEFGDVGQIFDPFTYLGFLAAHTRRIALGTGAAVATLRHPIHLAKAAASLDRLSGERFILGVASGDRPAEYPAFKLEHDYQSRGERFREAFEMFRQVSEQDFPVGDFPRFGRLNGRLDTVPKSSTGRIPAIVTGRAQQDISWIASEADGWFYYYMDLQSIGVLAQAWHAAVIDACGSETFKPFVQGMYIDLDRDPNAPLRPLRSGLRGGRDAIREYLTRLQAKNVSHVAFNLKFSHRSAMEVLDEMAEHVLPYFQSGQIGNRWSSDTRASEVVAVNA